MTRSDSDYGDNKSHQQPGGVGPSNNVLPEMSHHVPDAQTAVTSGEQSNEPNDSRQEDGRDIRSRGASKNHEQPEHPPEIRETARTAQSRNIESAGRKSTRGSKISFDEFAVQYRQHKWQAYKIDQLKKRQSALRKWLALSFRLYRVGTWARESLVDMTGRNDKAGFSRVHQSVLDLTETFYSHWRRDMLAFDPIVAPEGVNHAKSSAELGEALLPRLSTSSRTALFSFLNSVRSNPDYLVERIRSLNATQLAALGSSLKPSEVQLSGGLSLSSRSRSSPQKRMEAFSQGVEDYALAFERSSALSFLLFNGFDQNQARGASESSLRLQTWSAVCATLYLESEPRYMGFITQVIGGFALLSSWRARVRMELFLMDYLQRGAFLLEQVQSSSTVSRSESARSVLFDPFRTDEAKDFLDGAVFEMFRILNDQDGGLPTNVLEFACAVLAQLPLEEDQSRFRGHLFFQWYLRDFLRMIIMFPEYENMLLQCHISKSARDTILQQLWQRADEKVRAAFGEEIVGASHINLKSNIEAMFSRLEPRLAAHLQLAESTPRSRTLSWDGVEHYPFLAMSALDIVCTIQTISPPPNVGMTSWDPFVASSAFAFNAQYAHTTTKLDQLCREIMVLSGQTTSTATAHPCQERWMMLSVDGNGCWTQLEPRVQSDQSSDTSAWSLETRHVLDDVQKAALKLVGQVHTPLGTPLSNLGNMTSSSGRCLKDLFADEERGNLERTDRLGGLYWHRAASELQRKYPMSTLACDDTTVFKSILSKLNADQQQFDGCESRMEHEFMLLQTSFDEIRNDISHLTRRLNRLRTKIWYSVDVVHSKVYEESRAIATALANMATATSNSAVDADTSGLHRGRRLSANIAGPFLDFSHKDTGSLLRAPTEQGGPQKLSDSQIDLTKKWLLRYAIDNFCEGEERINRFCMEIKGASKKLVADTITESPDLWSSELFAREKVAFDASVLAPPAVQGSTRAASVVSDSVPPTIPWSRRPALDGGLRNQLFDTLSTTGRKSSFHSLGSIKPSREVFGTDRSSTGSSPGRAVSAATSDSISGLWSLFAGNTHSATSFSSRSRPGSTYAELETARMADQSARDKARFLESLQQDVICMLLSDLGCPVWSGGSETDGWLQKVNNDETVQSRVRQLHSIEQLVCKDKRRSKSTEPQLPIRPKSSSRRSYSAAPQSMTPVSRMQWPNSNLSLQLQAALEERYPFEAALQDLLDRVRQDVDPVAKLVALQEFKQLAILEAQSRGAPSSPTTTPRGGSLPGTRRSSFDPRATTSSGGMPTSDPASGIGKVRTVDEVSEEEIVMILRDLLCKLKPTTLFRDLQYIAAFVSPDMLNKTESGRAFLHVGLAALDYKREVCRSMVDVANKMAGQDLIKRRVVEGRTSESPLRQATEYWIYAAREGNAVAQRELATLYLSFPEFVPVVSLPLSLSSDVSKGEVSWQKPISSPTAHYKLRLALHWMQQAANNGDAIAKQKLRDREQTILFR